MLETIEFSITRGALSNRTIEIDQVSFELSGKTDDFKYRKYTILDGKKSEIIGLLEHSKYYLAH